MCRHLAYLGPPVSLKEVLLDPPHGLYTQSWAPRRQRHGTVNADGFGVGWYAARDQGGPDDPVPARYRRDIPIWNDPSLPDIARVTRSRAILAAVRSATAGTALGEAAAAPFGSGPWLFSHNGALRDWRGLLARPGAALGAGPEMPRGVRRPDVLDLDVLTDSALLWTLILARLTGGAAADVALAATIADVEAAGGTGRFNFLLTDGAAITATAAGDTLWYRESPNSVTVASEPGDDKPDWVEVPDRHLLTAVPGGPGSVTLRPLTAVTAEFTDHTEGAAIS